MVWVKQGIVMVFYTDPRSDKGNSNYRHGSVSFHAFHLATRPFRLTS